MKTKWADEKIENISQKVNRPVLAFLIVTIPGILYLLVGRVGLPEKYSFDSNKIQAISQGRSFFEDPAFQTVGHLYGNLGLGESAFLAGLVGCTLYGFLAFSVAMVNVDAKFTPTSLFYLIVMAICNAVYLSQYSKEFFQLPLVLVIIFLLGRKSHSSLLIAFAIGIYAYFFRAYWALTALMFLVLSLVQTRTKRNWLPNLFLVVTLILVFIPLGGKLIGIDVVSIRENLNIGRLGENFASTAISTPIVSNNIFISGLSQLLLAVELIVPFPLFATGDIQYFLIGVGIASIWVVFLFRGLKHKSKSPKSQTIVLMLAFLVTNSIFEPDFGSLLRHMTVLFPVMLLATWNPSKEPVEAGLNNSSLKIV